MDWWGKLVSRLLPFMLLATRTTVTPFYAFSPFAAHHFYIALIISVRILVIYPFPPPASCLTTSSHEMELSKEFFNGIISSNPSFSAPIPIWQRFAPFFLARLRDTICDAFHRFPLSLLIHTVLFFFYDRFYSNSYFSCFLNQPERFYILCRPSYI